MSKILFVGEGANDRDVVPIIVRKITGREFVSEFQTWREIREHRNRGFARKLGLAVFRARANGSFGVVATLDSDKHRTNRLDALKTGREKCRSDLSTDSFPIAIGEAVPELEAWLIDDSNAVKQALGLNPEATIPSPTSCKDVKKALEDLISNSPLGLGHADCLKNIAETLEFGSCRYPKKTGLEFFVQDVRTEFNEST